MYSQGHSSHTLNWRVARFGVLKFPVLFLGLLDFFPGFFGGPEFRDTQLDLLMSANKDTCILAVYINLYIALIQYYICYLFTHR